MAGSWLTLIWLWPGALLGPASDLHSVSPWLHAGNQSEIRSGLALHTEQIGGNLILAFLFCDIKKGPFARIIGKCWQVICWQSRSFCLAARRYSQRWRNTFTATILRLESIELPGAGLYRCPCSREKGQELHLSRMHTLMFLKPESQRDWSGRVFVLWVGIPHLRARVRTGSSTRSLACGEVEGRRGHTPAESGMKIMCNSWPSHTHSISVKHLCR